MSPTDGKHEWERSPLRGRLNKDLGEATKKVLTTRLVIRRELS